MEKKTIFLTGATGYLGSELLRYWIGQGHELIVLKRSTSCMNRIKDLEGRFVSYDSDQSSWEKSFKNNKIDAVVHVAASYGRKGESLYEIIDANIHFPIRLLDLAIQSGIKYFINTASSLPKEISDYSLSKAQFQEWVKQKKDNIHSINLVLEYFYGPEDDDWKFISMVIKKLKNDVPYINFTNGLQKRDFIFISDLVSAFDRVLNQIEYLKSGIDVPIGTGVSYSIRSVVELCKEIIGNNSTSLNFGFIPDRVGEVYELMADTSLMSSLNWCHEYSLELGLKECILEK